MTTSAAPPEPVPGRPRLRWPDSWPAGSRRRIAAVGVAAAVLTALIVGLAVGLSGGSPAPPDTAAARLVPAGALGYVNVSLNRGRPGVSRTLRLARTLPGFALAQAAVEQRLGALTGSGQNLSGGWLGDEAALAVVPSAGGGSQAGSLVLLRARSVSAARHHLDSVPASTTLLYRGIEVRALTDGSYVALLGRYVVAGQLAAVRQAVDVLRGAPSLASSSGYQAASAGEPAGRAVDLYAPAAGISALLGGRGGALAALDTLLDQPGLSSVSASLSPAPGGLRLQIHRVFGGGSGHATGTGFDASVLGRLPGQAAFALETRGLTGGGRLLNAAGELGVGGAIAPLLSRLGRALRAEGYDLTPLLQLFAGPTAVAVTDAGGHPGVIVLTRTADPAAARILLANLAPSLTALFPAAPSGPGVAPLFNGLQTHGMVIHQLQLGPGLQVNYTIYHRLVGVSTSLAALTSLAASARRLGASAAYRTAFGTGDLRAGSLVFLDLKVLIRLGQQTGILRGPGFAQVAPDLDRIRVIGVRARSESTESTSELYLNIP
jgi:hypothetical protein